MGPGKSKFIRYPSCALIAALGLCFAITPAHATLFQCKSKLSLLRPEEVTLSSLNITPQKRYVKRGPFRVLLESSGEVEMPLGMIIGKTETTDGTIAPILLKFAPPDWFTQKYRIENEPIENTKWANVGDIDRIALLQHVLRRDTAQRKKTKPGTSIGKNIPGLTVIRSKNPDDPSHYFEPALEFVNDYGDPNVVEVKFRSTLRPSEVRKVLMARFPDAPSLHVHATAPLDLERLRNDRKWEVTRTLDRLMRFNLMAEMASILHKGYPITPSSPMNESGTIHGAEFDLAASFFSRLSLNIPAKLNLVLKLGLVGTRGDETYDHSGVELIPGEKERPDDVYLLGSESRYLRKGKAGIYGEFPQKYLPLIDKFLDKTQDMIAESDIGPVEKSLEKWMRDVSPGHLLRDQANPNSLLLGPLFRKAWYNRSTTELLQDLPKGILKEISNFEKSRPSVSFKVRFDELTETGPIPRHEELKMLIQNWSRFPLFHGNKRMQSRIEAAQVKSLHAILSGADPGSTIRNFLVSSGIYRAIATSLGLERELPFGIRWRP